MHLYQQISYQSVSIQLVRFSFLLVTASFFFYRFLFLQIFNFCFFNFFCHLKKTSICVIWLFCFNGKVDRNEGPFRTQYSPFSDEHASNIELSLETDITEKKSALPPRTIKQRKRKRRQIEKLKDRPPRKRNTPVSSDELAEHVSGSYVYGRGGVLRESRKRSLHREKSSILYETDPSHKRQAQYLHKLDRHPALVLNADYQVSHSIFNSLVVIVSFTILVIQI